MNPGAVKGLLPTGTLGTGVGTGTEMMIPECRMMKYTKRKTKPKSLSAKKAMRLYINLRSHNKGKR